MNFVNVVNIFKVIRLNLSILAIENNYICGESEECYKKCVYTGCTHF